MRSRHTLSLHTNTHAYARIQAYAMFSWQHINTHQHPTAAKQKQNKYYSLHSIGACIHSLTYTPVRTHSHIDTLLADRFLDSRARAIWNYFCFCSRQWTSTRTRPQSFVVRFCFVLFVFKSVCRLSTYLLGVLCGALLRRAFFSNSTFHFDCECECEWANVCFCLFILHIITFGKKSAKWAWIYHGNERKKNQEKCSNFHT